MAEFFDYTCDACGRAYCERISVINLVLDQVEEAFCLECLAEQQGVSPDAFYHWILDYVNARDCFQGPWEKFNANPCPRIVDQTCFCKVSA